MKKFISCILESFALSVDNILGDDFYVFFGANSAGKDDWVTEM